MFFSSFFTAVFSSGRSRTLLRDESFFNFLICSYLKRILVIDLVEMFIEKLTPTLQIYLLLLFTIKLLSTAAMKAKLLFKSFYIFLKSFALL